MEIFKSREVIVRKLWYKYLLVLCCSLQLAAVVVVAQTSGTLSRNASALTRAEHSCVGVFLLYQVTQPPKEIPPFDPTKQPYSFQSDVTLTNYGYEEVPQWELSIDFQHDEIIAKADGVMFLSGIAPPGLDVSNGTTIVGVTTPGLLTSIDTADDPTLISTTFTLVGTEFGVDQTKRPLPKNMSLANVGYKCGSPTFNNNGSAPSSQMWVCCTENITAISSGITGEDSGFAERKTGDVMMTYDIMAAYGGNYEAQVNITMNDPMGRIDDWNLTWQWTQGEFIESMQGAQIDGPNDQDKCIYGLAATAYGSGSGAIAFENVDSCSPNPVIVDLPQDKRNDPTLGIPHCCRNGTLLPDLIDPAQSQSIFQLKVYQLPPHTKQTDISPPLNWNISKGYNCTQPVRVSPTEFESTDPEDRNLQSAVASWQVVCNQIKEPIKTCCASFSAYFNNSLIPCPTCSCGCSGSPTTFPWNGETCNARIPAILLPPNAVLLPPSNRTALGTQLAKLDHYPVPHPLPCPDNCGVSMNWHVYSDYTNSWSARLTLFNWDGTPIPEWSAAIELPNAMPGFQDVYSFNGSKVPGYNNTLFLHGHNKYDNDYLLGTDSSDNPGKLQSVLSFDKRKTPGIDVKSGDGYPTRMWFNGEECMIPQMHPAGDGWRLLPTFQFTVVLIATIFLLG